MPGCGFQGSGLGSGAGVVARIEASRVSERERAARAARGVGAPASERVGEPAGAKPLGQKTTGGEGGIRTPGTVSRTAVFKTACFNHSHTSPYLLRGLCPRTPDTLACATRPTTNHSGKSRDAARGSLATRSCAGPRGFAPGPPTRWLARLARRRTASASRATRRVAHSQPARALPAPGGRASNQNPHPGTPAPRHPGTQVHFSILSVPMYDRSASGTTIEPSAC